MFISIVFWLGFDRPSGFLFSVPALLLSILKPLFLPSSSVSFIIFHSVCSHAWEFGKTLVHEFPISYSHTNGASFFRQRNYMRTRDVRDELAFKANKSVTY